MAKHKYKVVVFSNLQVLLSAACMSNPDHVAAGNTPFSHCDIEDPKDNAVDAFIHQTGLDSAEMLVEMCKKINSFPYTFEGALFVPDIMQTGQMVAVVPNLTWIKFGCKFDKLLFDAFMSKPTCNILKEGVQR
jgi:hypothetical protein